MTEEVKNLQYQIDELKKQLFNVQFIPKEFRDNVLEIVLHDRKLDLKTTTTISLTGDPENITIPLVCSGYIVSSYRGNLIYLPFFDASGGGPGPMPPN